MIIACFLIPKMGMQEKPAKTFFAISSKLFYGLLI